MVQKSVATTISYDQKADILYLSYGPHREGIGEEVEDGVVVRRDPENDEMIGVTILDFSKRFQLPGAVLTIKNDVAALQYI